MYNTKSNVQYKSKRETAEKQKKATKAKKLKNMLKSTKKRKTLISES